ncbi:MAG TPA: ABC transporter ATP-binding protein [Geminicoccaceae bacterium]|nr:ABC transporter ATP-binding protein [Geminicoccaceae bacterium]
MSSPQPGPQNALVIEGVSFAYGRGRRALDDVSFRVPAGSFTALLGPNGAGKTTLMSLVTRLFHSRGGSIAVNGFDLRRASRAALAAMGVVFQRLTLDLDLSVQQNLRYAASLQGLGRARAERRIGEELERLGVADRRRALVRTLSGGLRRRVELARALLHEPRLLILDEPTVGLDIDSRRAIVEHVHHLCQERGLAVLWTTHLIDEVWPGDQLVILGDGRVRAVGPIAAVMAQTGCGDLAGAYKQLTTAAKP